METDEVSEEVTRERERKQIKNLITAQGGEEKGANQSGLYELCGESQSARSCDGVS